MQINARLTTRWDGTTVSLKVPQEIGGEVHPNRSSEFASYGTVTIHPILDPRAGGDFNTNPIVVIMDQQCASPNLWKNTWLGI